MLKRKRVNKAAAIIENVQFLKKETNETKKRKSREEKEHDDDGQNDVSKPEKSNYFSQKHF